MYHSTKRIYHPTKYADISFMGQARAPEPGLGPGGLGPEPGEGHISIFCGVVDASCGVVHFFTTPQKLDLLVLSYVVYPSF